MSRTTVQVKKKIARVNAPFSIFSLHFQPELFILYYFKQLYNINIINIFCASETMKTYVQFIRAKPLQGVREFHPIICVRNSQ